MSVPLPRQAVGPAARTIVVAGGAAELADALRRVAHAGWQPWWVARTAGAAWRMRVGPRD